MNPQHPQRPPGIDYYRPWGHALDYWVDAMGSRRPPGWKFFDSLGNQGELYSRGPAYVLDARLEKDTVL